MSTSTKPKLNEKLINCVLRHIEREVEKGSGAYNQNTWAEIAVSNRQGVALQCGTQGCFAGWACLLSTPKSEWLSAFGFDDMESDEWNAVGGGKGYLRYSTNGGFDFPKEAAKKLGLTEHEASYLFDGARGDAQQQLDRVKGRLQVIKESRKAGHSIFQHAEYEHFE